VVAQLRIHVAVQLHELNNEQRVVDISNVEEPDSIRMTVMLQSPTIKVCMAFITSWATSAMCGIGDSRLVCSILCFK
jgi:hypothetical protein